MKHKAIAVLLTPVLLVMPLLMSGDNDSDKKDQDMSLLAPSRLIDTGVEGLDVVVALGPLPGGVLLSCDQLLGIGGDLLGHLLSLLGGLLR